MILSTFATVAFSLALLATPQDILDPGLTTTGCRVVRPSSTIAVAQTFQPTKPGIVTAIRHGLDNSGGISSFNLYIAEATASGEPPLNYQAWNLYAGLGLTSFSSGSTTIDGSVSLSPVDQFFIEPEWSGKTFAIIFEKTGPGSLTNRQTSGGGAYSRGDGYVLEGGAWSTTGGCSGTRHDLAFEIHGDAQFILTAPSPGTANDFNSWGVHWSEPFETVFFAYSLATTPFTNVPTCSGLVLDLEDATSFGNVPASSSGFTFITKFVPASAAGKTVYFQAVQIAPACLRSNLVTHTF